VVSSYENDDAAYLYYEYSIRVLCCGQRRNLILVERKGGIKVSIIGVPSMLRFLNRNVTSLSPNAWKLTGGGIGGLLLAVRWRRSWFDLWHLASKAAGDV
jgi:hypothetical protein